MPREPLQAAVHKRSELKAQIEVLQTQLAALDAWISMYHQLEGETPAREAPQSAEPALAIPVATELTSRWIRKYDRDQIAAQAREAILEAGRPLQRAPLLAALEKGGLQLGGKNKARNLGTIMWRVRDRFVSIEGHGYWPKDLPYPAVGYSPA